MPATHIPALEWEESHSPTRKFQSFCRNISVALGGIRNVGPAGGGHPFDVQIRRIPAGATVCPFHAHLAQWELFLVQAGRGTVRLFDGTQAIEAGDVFIHPPRRAHQLSNTGDVDLEVLIVADNPLLDGFYYPDSQKWGLRPPNKFFRATACDYFDGEDGSLTPGTSLMPEPSVEPFRKLRVDDVPWETWESPKGRFRGASKELSVALGAKRNTPTGLGGHPFDLELSRLGPLETGCPYHAHAAQWELFLILAGHASIRSGAERRSFRTGDAILHPPGEPHQITNESATEPLEFLLIADNPPVDYWHYPDSDKWGLREPRMFFRPAATDYWDGEE